MSEKNSHNHAQERLKESLSATLDGQAGELELRRVLDSIGSDEDLRETARRYQMIGDTVRRETNEFMNVDLSVGIRERIADEEAPGQAEAPQTSSGRNIISVMDRMWSSVGRVAVAASVAFAVVLGMRNFNTVQDAPALAVAPDQGTLTQPLQIAQTGYGAAGIKAGYNSRQHDSITPEQLAEAQNVASRATRERFRAYALQHAEMSAMHSGQGVLPFARLTTFETQ